MAKDDMFADQFRQEMVRGWMKSRVENIHQNITAADVLAKYGVSLHKHGSQREQISCPFHGKDNHPSARYFPPEGESLSHVWCFVCHEHWDAIGLWKRFTGVEKFSELLHQVESSFGITPPPQNFTYEGSKSDPLIEEIEKLLALADNMLRMNRSCFEMVGYFKVGSILDRLQFQFERRLHPLPEVKQRVEQVIGKIREKSVATSTKDTID